MHSSVLVPSTSRVWGFHKAENRNLGNADIIFPMHIFLILVPSTPFLNYERTIKIFFWKLETVMESLIVGFQQLRSLISDYREHLHGKAGVYLFPVNQSFSPIATEPLIRPNGTKRALIGKRNFCREWMTDGGKNCWNRFVLSVSVSNCFHILRGDWTDAQRCQYQM